MEDFQNQYHAVHNINDNIKYNRCMHQNPDYSPKVGNPNHSTEACINKYPSRKSVTAHRVYLNQTPDLQKRTVDPPPQSEFCPGMAIQILSAQETIEKAHRIQSQDESLLNKRTVMNIPYLTLLNLPSPTIIPKLKWTLIGWILTKT